MALEYIIYSDESEDKGKYFSNFYGGLLVKSSHLSYVNATLTKTAHNNNIHKEIKWSKTTANYLKKYIDFIDTFFDLVEENKVKVRIMFTKNEYVPVLNKEQITNSYELLYYQFLKHSFGLIHSNDSDETIKIRLYLDKIPKNKEKIQIFKGHILAINKLQQFKDAKIRFDENNFTDVESEKHILLQALDVVLGSIQFRLNDKHKIKPRGKYRRGKKTIAKEKLYKHINRRIRKIYPYFNIGVTTGKKSLEDRWLHPYRHWLFTPHTYKVDLNKRK